MIAPAEITDDEFRLFRDFIHEECGLFFADNKVAFLSLRIGKRLAATSIGSFYRYYRYLRQRGMEHEEELLQLLDELTINETSFFRNRPQFEVLEQLVLPELIERKKAAGEHGFRIWSAGCSTGQEPYSIAISVLEQLPKRRSWDIRVYASDLSLSALERAASGSYPESKLQDMDGARRRRFFEACPDGFRVRDEVRRLVVYDFHNLKHENGLGDLDIIFCRNVLIYFDPYEQQKVVSKLIRALRPGGYLFLGHSESVQGKSSELEFVHHRRGTAYKKVGLS
ncbi:MAG: protein-glutamate O-methyltransferase CheR [Acidobacteriota bacterium]|nr:MAG: protein-glutamate O-methyltransferase CheR [Acidobacteriota bacterium]